MNSAKNTDIPDACPKPAQAKTAPDINISYRDMGQVISRVDQLKGEMKKAGRLIDYFQGVLAEKRGQIDAGSGSSVQLEREMASVRHKLNELKKCRKEQKTAAACCQLYGIFGIDYSVSTGRMYYMGRLIKHFSDHGSGREEGGCIDEYEGQQGELSAEVVRGSTGHVLYLRIYDYYH